MLFRQRKVTSNVMLDKESQEYFSRGQLLRPAPKTLPCSCHKGTRCIIILSLCLLLIIPLMLYHILLHHNTDYTASYDIRDKLEKELINFRDIDDYDSLGIVREVGSDLESRTKELRRIKNSVLEELKELESRRWKVREEIEAHQLSLIKIKSEISKNMKDLNGIYSAIEQAKFELIELREQDRPPVYLPKSIFDNNLEQEYVASFSDSNRNFCSIGSCFDYSKCSITSPFLVYLYNYHAVTPTLSRTYETVRALLWDTGQLTTNGNLACVFMVVYDSNIELKTLKFWSGDGRNHLVMDFNGTKNISGLGRSILVSDKFAQNRKFDIVLPPTEFKPEKDLPKLLPAFRKYLLSFWGEVGTKIGTKNILVPALKTMQESSTKDAFYFGFKCNVHRFGLCENLKKRGDVLKHSTFSLVPYFGAKENWHQSSNRRVYESFLFGAIPVILYSDNGDLNSLPYHEVLDYNLVSVLVPFSRITELHFLLRAVPASDLLERKRKGRLFFEHYFNGFERVLETAIALTRFRIGLPAPIVKEIQGSPLFGMNYSPQNTAELSTLPESDEYLGPIETPHPSPTFQSNFTTQNWHQMWNNQFYPVFKRYPYIPNGILVPTGARFSHGTSQGFRPIAGGEGGSGKEFSQAIGGNLPREQFTIVMLTYEREQVLISSIQRLNQLPYLHKVIVIWNGPNAPSPDSVWPKINVPVIFIKPENNSLNNRFLPYSHIETEGILSIDDDVHLTQAEIIFAFRVWRENRERIVGFPGRFHSYDVSDNNWRYNSNHSCELSMVLTGASFFHKYYNYIYSYSMPSSIRLMVDSLLNCEDLAMNFLVSHMTRKPPIKVTSKWTFRCPGCPETLSADNSHFDERHDCMRRLSDIYGYNPLLNTQYRVDSVLFKTRLPHIHQKCFKFI